MDLNRRRFLQITGGTAAFSAMSQSIARAAQIPAARRSGTIRDIEHIVVLMQENRSFDHYYGAMRGVRGFGDPRPVVLPGGKTVWHQSDGTRDILPFHPDADDLGMQFLQGLNHDWHGGQKAFNHGRYDQWIPAKTAPTMTYLERADIPFHYALADAFTICDAYHCSFIGNTDPNRYYMLTGHTGNDGTGGGPVLANEELGYGWTTYAERLEAAGISWKVYQDAGNGLDAAGYWGWTSDPYIGNYGDNSLLYFNNYRNAAPGSPLYEKARTGTDAKNGQSYFDILRADVTTGNLPQISWIAAPEAFSEHSNWPTNYGAWYISQILDALTADPDVWAKTALFITYDENDGFFDHIVPPHASANGASTADTTTERFPGNTTYAPGPYGLGPRVPMLVVSPWSKGGWVNSQTFDHTSLLQFMERRFGVREPQISPWRRAVCGDLTTAFDFARTDTRPARLPDTDAYEPKDRLRHPTYYPAIPAAPELPAQEKGSRPARALPYDLHADGRIDDGTLNVTFASKGKAGACFYITSTTDTTGPWTYTVEPGKQLTGTWDATTAYAITAYGPNGFLREFAGDTTTPGLEIRADHHGDDLRLTLTNHTKNTHTLQITDAYTGDHDKIRLRPGTTRTTHHRLDRTSSWYDLTITATDAPAYRRRVAGHIEDGRPSKSEPGLRTT
ncbi:phospholipase C [Actinocorallia herbida]|uniref:phospholipase C n=1 Tax=Actinocorallia herbida TaxID=58109 RepID=A0A3N1CYX5_9ACTN|nr:phospholipase C, phosphocholine-specific [Actinocorallia herbida]ROO86479.1 phospholipase C [Actinocorallia herbida]